MTEKVIKNPATNSPGIIEGIYYYDNLPVAIEIQNGTISKIKRLNKLSAKTEPYYLAPGLIDIQINGYSSVSFSLEGTGSTSSDFKLSASDIIKVTRGLWELGVTTFFPTITSNSREIMLRNFSVIAGAMNDPSLLGSIAGFHLEGPYISAVDGYRGAHPKEHVRPPDWKEFLEFYEASGEKILLITVAPEIKGAIEFIKKCREKGIVVSIGHHNGSAEIIKQAVDSGAVMATHLGNGCAAMINRHKNPIWPQLADDRIMICIICDGFHLPEEIIRVFFKVKGVNNTIITSDITSYAGMPDGVYKIKTGETVIKTSEGNLIFSGMEGGLYGSASPLTKGVGNIMKFTGCSLADAIQMASVNPARVHNLNDRGILEEGKRADIILFTMVDHEMKIKKTIVKGKVVYRTKV